MASVFNKITREWNSFSDTSGLSADWVIDPIFTNKERAMVVGPKYWTYNGNEITALSDAEILAVPEFRAEMVQGTWTKIQAERDRRRGGGVLIGSNWFHTDDTSRIQFLGLLMYGVNMPAGIMWKTMSNKFVEMTPTLVQQIFGSIGNKDTAIFTVAEQRRAIMNASPDPREYDHLTGSPAWPLIYGE